MSSVDGVSSMNGRLAAVSSSDSRARFSLFGLDGTEEEEPSLSESEEAPRRRSVSSADASITAYQARDRESERRNTGVVRECVRARACGRAPRLSPEEVPPPRDRRVAC